MLVERLTAALAKTEAPVAAAGEAEAAEKPAVTATAVVGRAVAVARGVAVVVKPAVANGPAVVAEMVAVA